MSHDREEIAEAREIDRRHLGYAEPARARPRKRVKLSKAGETSLDVHTSSEGPVGNRVASIEVFDDVAIPTPAQPGK